MIPIPAIIFNEIRVSAAAPRVKGAELTLSTAHIPVLREGNIIVLANTSLEVAEACSGIRSLISLVTLAIVYGYFTDNRIWARVVLTLAAMPVAVAGKRVRVAGTGVAAHYYGPEAAEGFFHTFSGWMLFVVAFVMLFTMQNACSGVRRQGRSPHARRGGMTVNSDCSLLVVHDCSSARRRHRPRVEGRSHAAARAFTRFR
jgi:exosortase